MAQFKGIGLVMIAGLVCAGCENKMLSYTGSGSSASSSSSTKSSYDVNLYAANKTVCNPLGGSGGGSSDPTQGLKASLWYLNSSQPRYHNVGDMIANGHASSENLFFNQVNVPTRLFTEGFPLQTGGSIADDGGQELVEYFALRFETVLHLGPNDDEGDYELGLLSDDGTIWSLAMDAESGAYSPVVSNDGDHPTQMGCGQTVHMTKSSAFNMRVDYYQGPRYHIALIPLWRKVDSSSSSEPLCGQNGNSMYFDYNNASAPEPSYLALLSRGWHPLTQDNYSVQGSTVYNPCTQGTAPVISNIQVINDLEVGYMLVTWDTDILATDQVLVTDNGSSVQTLTTSDNVLRTSHIVKVPGLTPNHTYSFQAISVSQDLGKTVSPAINFLIP